MKQDTPAGLQNKEKEGAEAFALDKLLTVVIPAYNSEKYLARCLDSLILSNACRAAQLLVIDDGSTDGTGRIADLYAERHAGVVKVLHKENGGHGSCINAGIAAAKGKYFRVVDSDDTVDPKAFRAFLRCLQQIDSDLIATPFVCVSEDKHSAGRESGRRGRLREPEGSGKLPGNVVFSFEDAADRLHVRMHQWTIRTAVLRDHAIRMSEHSFYVDMQFISFPVPWIQTCCLLDFPVYRYHLGVKGQSVAAESMRKNRGQHQRILCSLVRFYQERARAGDSGARLAYLAENIAKMQADQVKSILSLPVGKKALLKLRRSEQWLARECPAGYAANKRKSLRLLRRSGYRLYGAAALAWRLRRIRKSGKLY